MKRFFLTAFYFLIIFYTVHAQYSVVSPHSLAEAKIDIGSQISYNVSFNGKPVLTNSVIRFEFKQAPPMGEDMQVIKSSEKVINETWTPILKRKSAILNNCRELTLQLQEKKFPRRTINLVFRIFDDGVAFRTEFTGHDNKHVYELTRRTYHFQLSGRS